MRKYILALMPVLTLLILTSLLLMPLSVAGAGYLIRIIAVETNTTSYTQLPVIVLINNTYLASNGYINSTGLDTRVLTVANVTLPHMLADDKALFVTNLTGGVSTEFQYKSGYSNQTYFPIITGRGGYITTADNATLEPANNFTFGANGYIDTTAGTNKSLLSKDGALNVYVSASGNITADLYSYGAANTTYRREFTITGSADDNQTNYQLPMQVYRYIAESAWVTSPNLTETEAEVYGIIGSELFWANNYAGSNVGHIYKTNLYTGVTTTLKTGNSFAAWHGVVNGTVIYAGGEEKTDGNFTATLYRINTSGVTTVIAPGTGDCNELIAIEADDTYIYAGERHSGGNTTGSLYPNGGGLWRIPVATYNDTGTWARVYEDPAYYEWTSIIKIGTKFYAHLNSFATTARWKVISSTDLTNWTTELNYTAQNVGTTCQAMSTFAGDTLVSFGPVAADNHIHMFVNHAGNWTDNDLGITIPTSSSVKGYFDPLLGVVIFYVNDGNRMVGDYGYRSLYQVNIDGTNLITVNSNLNNLANINNPRAYAQCTTGGVTYVAMTGTAPTQIYKTGPFVSGNIVSLAGKSANWPYDIRILKSDGVTNLDYFRTYSDSYTANITVEFDSIPASPATTDFYIAYGNASDADVSNGTNTYIFFDDFSGNLSKWATIPSGWVINSGRLVANSTSDAFATVTNLTNVGFKGKINMPTSGNSARRIILSNNTTFGVYVSGWLSYDSNPSNRKVGMLKTGSTGDKIPMPTLAYGTTYSVELRKLGASWSMYLNDALIDSEASWVSMNMAYLALHTESTNQTYFDDIYLYNITANPPAITNWYAEQYVTTGTPTVALTRTISGVSSGIHAITVSADTVYFTLEVDSSISYTTLNGNTTIDNSNDWVWMRNNVAPYLDYIELYANGALAIFYEPIAIISGTTLPDRVEPLENGVITWGANPSGVTTSLTGIYPVVTPTPTVTVGPTTTPDPTSGGSMGGTIPIPSTPAGMYTPGVPTFPGANLTRDVETGAGLPAGIIWFIVPLIIILALGIFIHDKTKSLAAQFIVLSIAILFTSFLHIWPAWIMVPFGMCGAACVLAGKVYAY